MEVTKTRRREVEAFHSAAVDLFGEEGLYAIGERMPKDVRDATLSGRDFADEWVPDAFIAAWCEAVWFAHCEGHAQGEAEIFARYIDRMIDFGFARAQKLLLSLATPPILLRRAPELWRNEFTHGTLTYAPLTIQSGRLTLRDHVLTTGPILRAAIAEALRYAVSLTRTASVKSTHETARDGALHVMVSWA
jgi:hypothetical protein